jgi:hypothetical protein
MSGDCVENINSNIQLIGRNYFAIHTSYKKLFREKKYRNLMK